MFPKDGWHLDASVGPMVTRANNQIARARVPILCVDDEPQVLESLKLLLFRNYEVRVAENAQEGLKLIEAQPVPVVISDVRMPGMDGPRFLAEVLSRWPTTVGILLSGALGFKEELADEPITAAFRILTKPCEPALLRDTVSVALARHQDLCRQMSLTPTAG